MTGPGPLLDERLRRKRAQARAALWIEQLWPAVWPALGLLGAAMVVALIDVPALLPAWPRLVLPVAAALGVALLLARGWRRVVPPGPEAVDRRLERETGLRHRPLAALQDRPVAATAEAAWIWTRHQERLRGQLGRLRAGPPRPGLARRDRRALRHLVAVALAAAFVIAGPEAWARLRAAAWPTLPAVAAAPGTLVQAWITPPAYTALPPVFLQPGARPAPIPIGSHLTVGVTGAGSAPSLALETDSTEFRALDAASWQAERDLAASGRLTVRRGIETLAAWPIAILPDQPPVIAFADPPGPAASNGRVTLRTRLAWKAEDDYGVSAVQGELTLHDRPDAPPLVLAAPLAGSPKTAHGAITQDLTAHPWAGLPVIGKMVARDAAGQRGESPAMPFTLPERSFSNHAAQAVIAIRKQLSRTPDEREGATAALNGIADQPELFDNAASVALNLRGVGALLTRGHGQAAVDEAQARLWSLALALEEGGPDRTAKELAEARQEMRDAMNAARENPADPATQAELQQKMEALREAIQKHLDALAEQARRDGGEMPFDPTQPQMNARDLDRMAQRMEQAAKEGRMADAQQQMAEMEKLLEQLQNARPEHGEQREQRRAQRRQQGQQQMDAVQDIVRREGGLLDRSRTRGDEASALPPPVMPPRPSARPPMPGAPSQGAQSQPPQNQPPQDPASQDRARDQRTQSAMRRALGELMQRFGDLTGQIPAPLNDADLAMRDANQAMADGRDAAAGAAEQRAIEALQKGGQSMSAQLSRQFGRGQQEGDGQEGEGEGEEMGDSGAGQGGSGENSTNRDDGGQRPGEAGRRRSARRDPLGRPLPDDIDGREQSADGSGLGSQEVPTDMEQARSRALQDELRRRGADRTRPQRELDYIDRLLKDE